MNVQPVFSLAGDPDLTAGPPPALKIHLFGTMHAEDAAGRSVLPRVRKTRGLLAVLALNAPRPVGRAQLISLLWSRREPGQARASLRQALHELQTALGGLAIDLLAAGRHEIALRDRGLWVDALALTGAHGAHPDALGLFQPGLLADLAGIDPAFERWVVGERERLARAAAGLARQILERNDHPVGALAAAELLVGLDPADEDAWRRLIAAHAARGDRAAARAASERCRAALGASLRAPPAHPPEPGTPSTERAMPARQPPTAALMPGLHPPPHVPLDTSSARMGPARLAGAGGVGGIRVGVNGLRVLAAASQAAGAAAAIAAGLSEEIVAALSRFRSVSCVPLAALTAPLPGFGRQADAFWRHCEFDFLLDGTVQGDGAQVRVALRLLDLGAGGEVVWSARFDRPLDGLLALQDEIAGAAVARLEPRLLLWQTERARHRPNPDALRLLHLALPALFRLDRAAFDEAGRLLDQSRRLDPSHAATHAWLAHWHLFALGQGWVAESRQAEERLQALADEAVGLDPDDARGLALAAHVRGFIGHDADAAAALHERAVAANANLPLGWCLSGLNHAYRGDHAEAIRRARLARRLSPQDPLSYFFDMALAVPHLLSGADEAAARIGREAIARNPGFSSAYKTQLAALGHLGRREEAAEVRARLLALEPGFSVEKALQRSPIADPDGRARYAEGLRLGGLT